MATALRMPRWGMLMEEGLLLSWLKREGEPVEQGQGMAEVESDKTVAEIESPASGVVARLLVEEGKTVPVGTILAVIAQPEESPEEIQNFLERENSPQGSSGAPAGEEKPAASAGEMGNPQKAPAGERAERRISPAAKRLAEEKGVDWSRIQGSGPEGRIQISDVEKLILEQAGAKSASSLPKALPQGLSPLRQAITRRTLKSLETPQAALCREIDLTSLLELRARNKTEQQRKGISLTAYLIKFILKALQKVPVLNSTLLPEGHLIASDMNLGIVASAPGGIAVPVIHGAQDMDLQALDRELSGLIKRSMENSLTRKDLEGGTFTVSNAGPLGIDIFQALLNPPETAILGIGQIRRRPWVVKDTILPRDTAYFCLTTDHRVIDAEPAGEFLRILDQLLQKPDKN